MAKAGSNNGDEAGKDPVIEHFVELRKYIEHSHDGLSKRLERVETGVQRLDGRGQKIEGGLHRLERKVDAGFDRLGREMSEVGRKIDTLARSRRAAPRRRKP